MYHKGRVAFVVRWNTDLKQLEFWSIFKDCWQHLRSTSLAREIAEGSKVVSFATTWTEPNEDCNL